MESDRFFDARTCYQDGVELLSDCDDSAQKDVFFERIAVANRKLAGLNLQEAEHAHARGDVDKAIDHLELAKTLTDDLDVRKQADALLLRYEQPQVQPQIPAAKPSTSSSCASCSGSSTHESPEAVNPSETLTLMEYYELLIHQLPADQQQRYSLLGEEFAHAYVAASQDQHQEALAAFERCSSTLPLDIFCYEKGKILHRMGNDRESEQYLRQAVQHNANHSLAWINLALVLREGNRFQETLSVIETMITNGIMPEEALLLRADILVATGEHDAAVNQYVELLQTPWASAAAEKLCVILMEMGREGDAAVIFKKYMKKSCH
ncbi:MAG: hypothetical protein PHY09_13770 [Desulfuromonadaceae bacterium]|nr:hypothetical protein [Desulfuromonadaceae bacterium]MDD5105867.1 hypothetical protein [Desulfuromonadaceae bacterium]